MLGCVIGFTAGLNFYLVVALALLYGMTVLFDSGALTAGLVAETPQGQRGLRWPYTPLGFGMAFLAPLALGPSWTSSAAGLWDGG